MILQIIKHKKTGRLVIHWKDTPVVKGGRVTFIIKSPSIVPSFAIYWFSKQSRIVIYFGERFIRDRVISINLGIGDSPRMWIAPYWNVYPIE